MGSEGCEAHGIQTVRGSAEGYGAVWDEIDIDAATWTVPAERMKIHRVHIVPLSVAALGLAHAVKGAYRRGGLLETLGTYGHQGGVSGEI